MSVDSRIGKKPYREFPSQKQQLLNIGLNHQLVGEQLQNNQSFTLSQPNVSTRSGTSNMLQQTISMDGRMQGSDYFSGMFQSSTFKECMNQDMISSQLQNLMQQQDKNSGFGFPGASSFHEPSPNFHKRKGIEVSPAFYNPHPYQTFYNVDNSHNFGQCLKNDQEGSSMLFAFNESNMPPLVDLQKTSEEDFPLKKIKISSDSAFPIRNFSYLASGNGLFQNEPQMVKSKQSNQQPCPPPRFDYKKVSKDGSSNLPQLCSKQFHGFQSSKPPGAVLWFHKILLSYLNYKSKSVDGSRSQPDFVDHLHMTICNGRRCDCEKYLMFTSHFDQCHRIDCTICAPVLQFYITKINSGLDYNLPPNKNIISAPEREFSSLHSGGIFGDTQSTPKPMKMDCIQSDNWTLSAIVECKKMDNAVCSDDWFMRAIPEHMNMDNVVPFDDWSLSAIAFSASSKYQPEQGAMVGEEISLKMNMELLRSQESPRVYATGNGAVDNGGSKSVKVSLGKFEGHLGPGQSSEGDICNTRGSNSMDKEMNSSIENTCESLLTTNDASDTKKLCDDNGSFHSEEPVVADEEMICINSSKFKTSSYQDMDDASDGKKLCNDYDSFHSEESIVADKHPEMTCVNTSKVKTLSCQGMGDASDTKKVCNDYESFHFEEPVVADKEREMACINTSTVQTINCQDIDSAGTSVLPGESCIGHEDEIKPMLETEKGRVDVNCDSPNCKDEYPARTELENPKGFGVSLTDFFNAEQIKEHLRSLNPHIDLRDGKESTGETSPQCVDENTCQLCAMDRLELTAPPLFCTNCRNRIKDKAIYYTTLDEMNAQHCFCTLCFKGSRGGNISFKGLSFPKAKLTKEKNIKKIDEAWVRCDKCERWQHQICALYNPNRDLGGKEDYICPFCRLAEISAGQHTTPPAFSAKDLPKTMLSDHIERRLCRALNQERNQRAESLGKSTEEVPPAEDLVVRVVLAVKKHLKVKQQFLDILHGETYPAQFPYKSKVIMLFQKVDGVDVCLFAMYVQEFGSECGHPNQRSVYISYLDSVKYFRPDIKTVVGEALRTFVYHEILIGYLDYCKQRGFTTCYIWACAPLKGDDYILYCHPETQKIPKPDKLRQWYKLMLKKALREKVVVEYTNFYDYFLVPNEECNKKITAARLPYFDGDYWSGAIEDTLRTMEKESGGGESVVKVKKLMTKRTLRAMGHSDLSVDASKDILVMQKLCHNILPVKEDFIVAHLQYTCINCQEAILSGNRWSCDECSNFHLCGRCFEVKQSPGELKTHTNNCGETHILCQVPVNVVAADTEDNDAILDNDFFENRHSFLDFCQKNNYQFDTLRRAKYSSMMIMHHLRKMTALTMGTICNICHQDIMAGWHCEICSQFQVCSACYQKKGDACHVHKLSQNLSNVNCKTKSKKLQQQRAIEVKTLLELLSHANHCPATRDIPCSYPKCLDIKKLFFHNSVCKSRVAGGCESCKKIWSLLCLHSRYCENSDCKFPRCMDIKNHKENLAAHSEAQRRAGVRMPAK